jgi:soluble lytic murein transglycosylase
MISRSRLLLFALVLPLALAARAAAPDNETERVRLTHAKELLGKRYAKSVVRKGEGQESMRFERFIREWSRKRLKAWHYKGRTDQVAKAIVASAKKHQLDPLFVMAVIQNESGFNVQARGRDGEIGLMQLMPDTAKWLAKRTKTQWRGKATLLDPATNIKLGTEYLALLRTRFDNHGQLYLAAYNMGPKNVRRALARAVRPKDYPLKVMSNYVKYYAKLSGRPAQTPHTVQEVLPVPPAANAYNVEFYVPPPTPAEIAAMESIPTMGPPEPFGPSP